MVLGLIDFLLGGKRKNKVPKSAQVASPLNGVGNNVGVSSSNNSGQNLPNGVTSATNNVETKNVQEPNFGEGAEQGKEGVSSKKNNSNFHSREFSSQHTNMSPGQRRPVSEVISKIHDQLKETNERMTGIVGDIKNMQNDISSIGHRLDDLEEAKKITDEKISEIDSNMTKFLSLYELINNQYNPFVEKEESKKEPLIIGAQGETMGRSGDYKENVQEGVSKELEKMSNKSVDNVEENLESSLLELDTLNIEEAAGDAVPLTKLKNNTNSLVIILSWLEYLVKRVGIDEARNTLNYYTETLKWITPEVYFDLDKYLKGMKEKKEEPQSDSLTIKDHIVSLYFISKLNEKSLDPKLTKAVLQIIKE